MTDPSWSSLLPPLLAIALAITTRQVIISLVFGIWLGYSLLPGSGPLIGLASAIDGIVAVMQSAGDARVIIFTLVIGGLIATLEASGGVRGFVVWLEQQRWVTSGRRSQWLAWAIGMVIFVESNITVLVAGSVARPLFDRFKIAREKLAYLIDSTSAPVCMLIPLNAWGAFNLGLLDTTGVENPLDVFIASIPLNLYAFSAVIMSALSIVWRRDIGPMRKARQRTEKGELLWPNATPMVDPHLLNPPLASSVVPRARNMVVPILSMVAGMPIALWITGDGNLMAGSGSTSVLWAVLFALAVCWVLLLSQRASSIHDLVEHFLRGAGGVMPLALILLLALALGDVTEQLKAGVYVANLVKDGFIPQLVLPVMFLISAGIAFSVGSSWGTFAIMIPIAVPVALGLDMPVAPFVAAVLSGGIFGDHASPISDTTVVASMAAATDHIDHVRTQMPYALVAGGVSLVGFVVMGLVISL